MSIENVENKLDKLTDSVNAFTIKTSELLAVHTVKIENNTDDINRLGRKISDMFTSTRVLVLFAFTTIMCAIIAAKFLL